MAGFDSSKVINGTFGQLWLDGDLISEATALQAKATLDKQEVPVCGTLTKKYKIVGLDYKGTIKLNKVNSRFIEKMSANLRQGKETTCTIISKLADPNAYGAERIALKNVKFDELTLIDWEAKKNGELSIPFTFEDFQLLDTINPQ
jgi:hypothetical protein